MSWTSWWVMVGWIEYMGRCLLVSRVDGRSDLVVLPRPATGPASDLGVVCSAEVVTDAVLPLLDEHAHDVWVLVEHCPVLLGDAGAGRRDVGLLELAAWRGRETDR